MQFGIMEMIESMGLAARMTNIILLIMSMYSIGVMIERWWAYRQAKTQSRAYAPQVAKLLKDGKIGDAIKLSGKKENRYSHLAKVLLAGLQEYQFQQESGGTANREEMMEAAHRAIERATELKAKMAQIWHKWF